MPRDEQERGDRRGPGGHRSPERREGRRGRSPPGARYSIEKYMKRSPVIVFYVLTATIVAIGLMGQVMTGDQRHPLIMQLQALPSLLLGVYLIAGRHGWEEMGRKVRAQFRSAPFWLVESPRYYRFVAILLGVIGILYGLIGFLSIFVHSLQ